MAITKPQTPAGIRLQAPPGPASGGETDRTAAIALESWLQGGAREGAGERWGGAGGYYYEATPEGIKVTGSDTSATLKGGKSVVIPWDDSSPKAKLVRDAILEERGSGTIRRGATAPAPEAPAPEAPAPEAPAPEAPAPEAVGEPEESMQGDASEPEESMQEDAGAAPRNSGATSLSDGSWAAGPEMDPHAKIAQYAMEKAKPRGSQLREGAAPLGHVDATVDYSGPERGAPMGRVHGVRVNYDAPDWLTALLEGAGSGAGERR